MVSSNQDVNDQPGSNKHGLVANSANEAGDNRDLATTVPESGYDKELSQLVAASKQIAKMAEPTILTARELDAQKIIHPYMDNQRLLNKFRELRTKLLKPGPGSLRSANSVTLVTSVSPNGGATFTALNLAAAVALDESKTALIIDCNLEKPSMHDRVYLQPEYGLTDFLRGDMDGVDSIIYATGIARLRLIPAGGDRERSTEFFTSPRMRAFLDIVKRRYADRHIFIDAPPVLTSADTQILASLCDRALLVVPYGRAFKSQVMSAIDVIGEDKLAGVILNN